MREGFKAIVRWVKARPVKTALILVLLAGAVFGVYGILQLEYAGRRFAGGLILIGIWLFHLFVSGAGAAFAIFRLSTERSIPFVRHVMIYLHEAIIDALAAVILLLFFSRGVKFTWRFSAALFGFLLLRNLVRLPFLLFVLRGPTPTR